MPRPEKLLLRVLPNVLTPIGFELDLPMVADVGNVGGNGADAASAAGYFDHNLGHAPDGALDLLDLGDAQAVLGSSSGSAENVKERLISRGQSDYTSSHERVSQAMRAALVTSAMRCSSTATWARVRPIASR